MEKLNFTYGILFTIQLFISEAAFLIGRPRKENYYVRLGTSAIGYFLMSGLWVWGLCKIGQDSFVVAILFYFGVFLFSMIKIKVCYELEPIEILFVGTGGYAMEHITFAVTRMIQFLTGWKPEVIGIVYDYILFRIAAYMIAAALIYFLLIRKNRLKEEFKKNDIRLVEMALFVLVSAVVLSVIYSSARFEMESPIMSNIVCPIYSTLCCILVLIMEYYVFRENRLSREKENMEQMLQMAQAQQKSSKEAINIINMKCHDLKHQIAALAKIEDSSSRSEYVEEMRKAISIYDATYHTGCEALDYVLREKNLLSEEYGVMFSCMADGSSISFMQPADIYALMGNALDNALECVMKEVVDKRIISIQIARQKQTVLIHIENTCTVMPQFEDGLPVTIKADKMQHGFGVKSIRYIAEKYYGNVVMRVKNQKFILDVLFPEI